jgi:hypothetical protein
MTTNITITTRQGADIVTARAAAPSVSKAIAAPAAVTRKLPGWLWFIALWCFGVASAVSLGFAFKLLMNATLFAVK